MDKEQNYQHSDEEISLVEIIQILWTYKWLIIITPLIAAIIAYTASQFMTPSYQSATKLYLGNFGNEMYTDAEGAEEVILSRDILGSVMEDLNLEYEYVRNFKKTLAVRQLPASMIEVEASHYDPEMAKQIANKVVEAFIAKAEPAYLEKLVLVEKLYESTLENYNRTTESLDRNKQALTAIETNPDLTNTEKDLSRVRLIDYIRIDEEAINNLNGQLQQQQLNLLDIQKAEIFEQASVPLHPSSPNKMLNTAIALVLGAMIAVGLAFIIEYFKNNPIHK